MVEEIVNPSVAKWAHLRPNQHCSLTISNQGQHVWINSLGQLHRVDADGNQDGPARIWASGEEGWFLNGYRHRLGGIAMILTDGEERWYLDNVRKTQEEWASDPRVIELHSRTQEGAEEWLKRL